jgi:hypothetical protein
MFRIYCINKFVSCLVAGLYDIWFKKMPLLGWSKFRQTILSAQIPSQDNQLCWKLQKENPVSGILNFISAALSSQILWEFLFLLNFPSPNFITAASARAAAGLCSVT